MTQSLDPTMLNQSVVTSNSELKERQNGISEKSLEGECFFIYVLLFLSGAFIRCQQSVVRAVEAGTSTRVTHEP